MGPPHRNNRTGAVLLDFTNGAMPSGATYSRADAATSATYQDASGNTLLSAPNTPRFSYSPKTGRLGYRVEPGKTNVVLYPENISTGTGYWTTQKMTLTQNAGASSVTGVQYTKLTAGDLTSSNHTLTAGNTTTTAQVWTASCELKPGGHQWVQVLGGTAAFGSSVWASVDIVNGVVGNTGTSVLRVGLLPVAGGGFRCFITALANATTAQPFAVVLTNNTNAATRSPVYVAADTTNGVLATAMQFEVGEMTSYIGGASGAARSRAPDFMSFADLAALGFNATEGTIVVEYEEAQGPSSGSGTHTLAELYADSSNYITCGVTTADGASVDSAVVSGGATIASTYLPRAFAEMNVVNRAGWSFKTGSFYQSVNGMEVGIPTAGTLGALPAVTTLSIGCMGFDNTQQVFNGLLYRIWYYPTQLSQLALRKVTSNTNKIAHVFGMIGQSNVDGRGTVGTIGTLLTNFYGNTYLTAPNLAHSKLYCYYKPATRSGGEVDAGSFVDNGQWYLMGKDHSDTARRTHEVVGDLASTVPIQTANYAGPELELAYKHSLAYPDTELRIIKFAVGGSSITSNWDIMNASSNKLWYLFKNYVFLPAIADLIDLGYTPVLMGMYWLQGETDADNGVSTANYTTYLQKLVDRINTELGFTVPKIVIGGLGNGTYAGAGGVAIKAAQQAVAGANANTVYMATDGGDGQPAIALNVDGIHYTAAGQNDIADKLWAIINV
jgi:hypothetical protein